MPRCKGKTAAGRICKCKAIQDSTFCLAHQPETVAEREKKAAAAAARPKPSRQNELWDFQRFIYDQEWKIFSGQQKNYDYSAFLGKDWLYTAAVDSYNM